jgi:hypothetical protein
VFNSRGSYGQVAPEFNLFLSLRFQLIAAVDRGASEKEINKLRRDINAAFEAAKEINRGNSHLGRGNKCQ